MGIASSIPFTEWKCWAVLWMDVWFQFIPQIRALEPITTAIPLAIVLGITAIKDLIDDIVSQQNGFFQWRIQSGIDGSGCIMHVTSCRQLYNNAVNFCLAMCAGLLYELLLRDFYFSFYRAKRSVARYCHDKLSVRLSVCLWRWWIVITRVGIPQK